MTGDPETHEEKGGSDEDLQSYGPVGTQEEDANRTQDPGQEQEAPTKKWRWPQLRPEWALVGLTGALVLTTLLQWRAAREAIDLSKSAMKQTERVIQLQERAWISIEVTAEGPPAQGKPFDVKITMKNTGASPALRVFPNVFMSVKYPTAETINRLPIGNAVDTDIGPGQEHFRRIRTGFPLDKDTMDPYVYGTVHYRDIFGIQRKTTLCFRAMGSLETFMEFCPEFNRME